MFHSVSRPLSGALLFGALAIAGALLLGGCTQTAGVFPSGGANSSGKDGNAKNKRVSSQFADLPVPKGAKMNIDKTFVVGTETWFGQLTLDTNHNANTMFDFYERELSNYGWRKITSVRAKTSILGYDRDNRIMTIAIQPGRILGSEISITVSPREKSQVPAAAPAAAMPAPMKAPMRSAPLPPVRR